MAILSMSVSGTISPGTQVASCSTAFLQALRIGAGFAGGSTGRLNRLGLFDSVVVMLPVIGEGLEDLAAVKPWPSIRTCRLKWSVVDFGTGTMEMCRMAKYVSVLEAVLQKSTRCTATQA